MTRILVGVDRPADIDAVRRAGVLARELTATVEVVCGLGRPSLLVWMSTLAPGPSVLESDAHHRTLRAQRLLAKALGSLGPDVAAVARHVEGSARGALAGLAPAGAIVVNPRGRLRRSRP